MKSMIIIFGAVLTSADLEMRLQGESNEVEEAHEDHFFGGDPMDPDNYLDASPEGVRRRASMNDMVQDLLKKMPGADAKWKWKDSYGNGWGEPLQVCRSGKEQIGALCYDRCPRGYYRRRGTVDCMQYCPSGWRDDGNYCRQAEYGRGVGYGWKWGDTAFSLDGARSRCNRDHRQGCEKYGAIIYPKCRSGYYAFGCCICRPNSFRCSDFGLGHQFDLSCHKKYLLSPGLSGLICKPGYYQGALLCYPNCRAGYHGVGPVCWETKPRGWEDCGLFWANSKTNCALGPIRSAFEMAITIPAVVIDASVDLGKCLVDHTINIADKTCSWKDVTGGCAISKIGDKGFKVGCPLPSLALGVEIGAREKVSGGNEFTARGTMGNLQAFTRSWAATPLKNHVYMFGNFEWDHTSNIELRLQDDKFWLKMPGSKFDMDATLAVYNPTGSQYDPCTHDSCTMKLNEGKERLVETSLAVGPFPLLVELDAAIRLTIKPKTTNLPMFQVHVSLAGDGIPVLKSTEINLHQDQNAMLAQLARMVDEGAIKRAVAQNLDVCLADTDAMVEGLKQRFEKMLRDVMSKDDASILTAQIEETVEAQLDICVGVDVKFAVSGVGATTDIEICFEAKVDAIMTADINGVTVEYAVEAKLLPIDDEIEIKVPATALVDTACAFSQLGSLQLASKCVPYVECGRKFAESTCNGIGTQLLNGHAIQNLAFKAGEPIDLPILKNEMVLVERKPKTETFPNPAAATLKQAAALGLDPLKIMDDAAKAGKIAQAAWERFNGNQRLPGLGRRRTSLGDIAGTVATITGEALSSGVLPDVTAARWHLAPAGAASCDRGVVATQSECEAAVQSLASSAGATPGRGMLVGSHSSCGGGWGAVPLGCAAQTGGDWAAHFRTSGPAECSHEIYQLVCSGSGTDDIFQTVVNEVVLPMLKGETPSGEKLMDKFDPEVGGIPLSDGLELLEQLAKGNYRKLIDHIDEQAGLGDMASELDCGGGVKFAINCDHLEITDGGNCVKTKVYGNDHDCTITVNADFALDVKSWDVENHGSCAYDYVQLPNGSKYCTNSPNGQRVTKGQTLKWHTDYSVTEDGWKICAK